MHIYKRKYIPLISPVLAILADNPRHSELLNHSGRSANKYCRMCMVSKYEYIHTGLIYLLSKVDKKADPSSVADMLSKAGALEHIQTIARQQTETITLFLLSQ